MRKIELLEQSTIDKIAAGEVVERPASVVKELFENAIDAGATAITIEIRDGGVSLIRVTDNGAGIPHDQIRMAFLRHATSKLRTADELTGIGTLGFRGEALSSIAAVSRVELVTRTKDALTGSRYCIEGGKETVFEEVGAPSGTTFLIRNLFFNTPARARFLKSAGSETNRIIQVTEALALANPECSVRLIAGGQVKLFTGGNGTGSALLYQIFGREIIRHVVPVSHESELIRISGWVGLPEAARGNRGAEHYFINGRYSRNKIVQKALEDACQGLLMQHRYPFSLLYLDMNRELVDVNVHPAKMEVRISRGEEIYQEILSAVRTALTEKEQIPGISFGGEVKKTGISDKKTESLQNSGAGSEKEGDKPSRRPLRAPEPFETHRIEAQRPAADPAPGADPAAAAASVIRESSSPYGNAGYAEEAPLQKMPVPERESGRPIIEGTQTELFEEAVLSEKARPGHRLIGQLFDTYWMIEYADSLYIVDQHAAHEKVLYEQMMKAWKERKIQSQMLRPGRVLALSRSDSAKLEAHLESFRELGYEAEPFGGGSWRITAVPYNLFKTDPDELFKEILDHLDEPGDGGKTPVLERIASMSCKAAVKGNHSMSVPEAETLIDELLTLDDPYHCPHGRPTIVSMSHRELDRKFKRIL